MELQTSEFMFDDKLSQNKKLVKKLDLSEPLSDIDPALFSNYFQQSIALPGEDYSGATVNNMRNGVGKCKWSDGSTYEGVWKDNLRHGNGKFTQEGKTYLG